MCVLFSNHLASQDPLPPTTRVLEEVKKGGQHGHWRPQGHRQQSPCSCRCFPWSAWRSGVCLWLCFFLRQEEELSYSLAAQSLLVLFPCSLTTVCLPHRPASSSCGCLPTPASWSWPSACATPSITAAPSTWTTTCSRETWTTPRAPTPTTERLGCCLCFSLSAAHSQCDVEYFHGNSIDILET